MPSSARWYAADAPTMPAPTMTVSARDLTREVSRAMLLRGTPVLQM